MEKKKNVPINYYARDYQSIKQSLVEHAKRYYPEVYKDFNEASFGSLMFDTVSYVGDVLSFYLDYQANESFISTATELKNITKLAKQMGYRHDTVPTSYGVASFFITVPATSNGLQPDTSYIPVLKRNSEFVSDNGVSFILLDDVRFDKGDNEIVVAANDPNTNIPTYWAIKSYGAVMSGRYENVEVEVGSFERFLRVKVPLNNIAEVVSVKDDEGNDYYQVENLSQDTIYVPIANRTDSNNEANSLLRPYSAPRRFVIEKDAYATYLQFGYGTDSSDSNREKMIDPSEVVLKKHAKNYISDSAFDPSRLVQSDKLGIVPVNTKLQIRARINETNEVNVGIDKLTTVSESIFEFDDPKNLDKALMNFVKSSLELTNEEKIVGHVPTTNGEEIKIRALNSFSAQNRAVTLQDYKTLVYNMPNTYGKVKRVNVARDKNSLKRNLNLYTISQDESGKLTETNSVVKENMKVWLNNNRMVNDTIDIIDAKILNLGINYTIVVDVRYNKQEILNKCNNKLKEFYSYTREIGEPFFISDVNNILKEVKGVSDIGNVVVTNKNGGLYSDLTFDLDKNRSPDGRYIEMPLNVIFEIKYPDEDIKGAVI